MAKRRGRAAVVVLGDLGRSPRMQNHALSLAKSAKLDVDVIGYEGSQPLASLRSNPKINLHLMKPLFTSKLPRPLYLITLPLKLIFQTISLIWTLCFTIPAPDVFILQNPPTIPTFTILQFASWLRGAELIIDWHNFGYTLLGITLGADHALVRIHQWYERKYGPFAHHHLCVSQAMQNELYQNWGIRATVVRDRPPATFRPITVSERHQLLLKLHEQLMAPMSITDFCNEQNFHPSTHPEASQVTIATTRMGNEEPRLRDDRPVIIVSSTSWTPDEDFELLLEAAIMYDSWVAARAGEAAMSNAAHSYPNILFIITGKGPQRAAFEERVSRLRLDRVAFRLLWLSPEDYPVLLASADLGLSLHCSSSGFDLPMKVVDMFGCGVPVASASYLCIGELVKDWENGRLFTSSHDLCAVLTDAFRGFPRATELYETLSTGARVESKARGWDDEWNRSVLPILDQFRM